MEVTSSGGGGGGGGMRATRRSRETSPDPRARVCLIQPHNPTLLHHQQQHQQLMPTRAKPFRKVQVVYYLCRNGQLEQPHFMEVTHLPNQHLRLKDVIDRLTVLRGNRMPSMYSWSCKRSYKNGYVWNDLSENDVIYPADGVEYILKGSEIIQGCADRFQHLQLAQRNRQPGQHHHHRHGVVEDEEEEEDEELEEQEGETEELEEEYKHVQHNNAGSCSNTPNSRCSRGVSTDELDVLRRANPVVISTPPKSPLHHQQQPTEMPLDEAGASPPSSSSSEKLANTAQTTNAAAAASISAGNSGPSSRRTDSSSARFEDALDDPDLQPARAPSVLLQLIACGSVAVKGKAGLLIKHSSSSTSSSPSPAQSNHNTTNTVTHTNGAAACGNSGRKSSVNLHRGVLCRLAATRAAEDDDEINYMSENPRFGNPQLEDKEYFSGSILEAIANESRAEEVQPSLKKSSSYNEERSMKSGLGEAAEKVVAEERSAKAKCMPSRNWMRSTCRK